tara:strand:+ start:248 stop:3241 length:2994 start_codon:yes stop_codon:yes gene_type:complete
MKKYFYILFFLFSFSFSDLINPENAATLNYIHVLFEWEQESYASTYNFQLDTSSNFNNPIVDINNESLIYIETENINWETTYYWRVRPVDINGVGGEWINTLSFTTGSTRSNAYSINYNDNQYSNGVTIFSSFFNYYSAMIDQNGNEIWNTNEEDIVYYNTDLYGQLFGCYVNNDIENYLPGIEFNLDNEFVWEEPNEDFLHHELMQLPNGNYIGLVETMQLGPIPIGPWTSLFQILGYTADGITNEFPWIGDKIVIWDKDTKSVLWEWNSFDYFSMLDYDTLSDTWFQGFTNNRYDWTHANAFWTTFNENNEIESIYLSSRHLSRITKIDYATSEVIWNLGHEMPSGDVDCGQDIGFSFQHALTVLDNGNIVTLDNGNLSTQFLNTEYPTTRGLELSVIESNNSCEASIYWEYSLPEEYFGFASGNVQKLDNGNYLIVTVGDGGTALEVNPLNEHIWEGKFNLQLPNGAVYRASRLSGLHPISYSVIINEAIVENNNNYLEVLNNDSVANFSITIYNEGSSAEQYYWAIGQENGNTEYLNPGESFIINNNQNLFTNQELLSMGEITVSLRPKHRTDLKKDININFIELQCDGEFDCSGECNGDAYLDECGQCMCGLNSDPDLYECDDDDECEQGCDGEWYSDLNELPILDECGICNGDGIIEGFCDCNNNILDCSGICGGNSYIDECGICNGDNSTCNECDNGYTYFEEIPSSTILLDGNQCFSDTDLNSLIDIINTNNLDIESPIHLGTQNWFGGRITRLEAGNYFQGGNVILHTIPESISNMANLGVLYFNYNELTQLPNSITELSNLIYLVLSFNQLTSFPENIGDLSQLIWIDAGYNELESIPESIGQLSNLSYLWIFNNNLTSIPESICDLDINWNGDDFQFLPYFGAGANSLCDEIPVCIQNSSNLNSSIDPLYYSFEITLEQECSDQCLIMDVNNDGLINVIDIVNTVNIILEISSNPTDIELCAADANSDNVINVIDVVTIVNFIFSF